jgi:hypothetical protein
MMHKARVGEDIDLGILNRGNLAPETIDLLFQLLQLTQRHIDRAAVACGSGERG